MRTGLIVGAVLVLLLSGLALAANPFKVQVTVVPGSLTANYLGGQSLNSVTLDGTDKTTTGTVGTIEVVDARGSGLGWSLNIKATDFVETSDPSRIIDITPGADTGFSVPSAPTVNVIAGNTAPSSFSGNLDGTGFNLLSAAANTGMGTYQTTPDLELKVPAETYSGTYESTVTLTVN